MKERYPAADRFAVTLFGSLAYTAEGHDTTAIVRETLAPIATDILCDTDTVDLPHPNTMELTAYAGGEVLGTARVYSVGGGQIKIEGETLDENRDVYPLHSFAEIADYCEAHGMRLWQYVELLEGVDIRDYLHTVWETMKACVAEGLRQEGTLPGRLQVQRKAKHLYSQNHIDETRETRENRLVCAYAFAVSEQNAAGGRIVTAPTCGATGVLPAVL
jgi:L-serine dehydratase